MFPRRLHSRHGAGFSLGHTNQVLGTTYRKQTPAGNAYITINEDGSGPFEVFVNVGKAGSEVAAEAEAIGRLVSYILRMPSNIPPEDRLHGIISQLKGIGSGRPLGFGKNRVMSLPDGIAQVFSDFIVAEEDELMGLPEEEDESEGDSEEETEEAEEPEEERKSEEEESKEKQA